MSKLFLCCSSGLKHVIDPIIDLSNITIPQIITDLSNITIPQIITDLSNITIPQIITDLSNISIPQIITDLSNISITNIVTDQIIVSEIISNNSVNNYAKLSEIIKSEYVLSECTESINTIVDSVNKLSEEISTDVNQYIKLKDE